jgi:two-component system sensor histidine kinase MtrB
MLIRSAPRLRSRLVVVLLISVAAVAIAVTVSLTLGARSIIYESRQNVLLNQFEDRIRTLETDFSPDGPMVEWDYAAEQFSGPTQLKDLSTGRTAGSLTDADIPPSLVASAGDDIGPARFLRTDVDGTLTFFATSLRPDASDDSLARMSVTTAFSLQPERNQVNHLFLTGVIVGGAALVAVGLLSAWFAAVLTRTLGRLGDLAGRTDAHEISRFSSGFRDVDDIGRALQDSSARLDESMRQLAAREDHARRLVSDVAHELRTPLTSMVAVAEILDDLDGASAEEVRTAVGVTRRSTARLVALVEDLVEVSRLDAGVARVVTETGNLGQVLHSVVDVLTERDDVDVRCPADLSVTTDIGRLRTIVSNLVVNALRHGRAPVTITVEKRDDRVRVIVHDEGAGIPPADAERVFDRFTMLDTARVNSSSSGLGLAIARDNARLLGGDLLLEPADDGSTFVLSLPVG